MRNVDFYKTVASSIKALEHSDLTDQQLEVISDMKKSLERFLNWTMTDDEADQVL